VSVKIARTVYSFFIVAAVIILVLFFGSGFFSYACEKVLPGVEVMGVSLEGLSKTEGVAKLAELESDLRATRVELSYQGLSWPLLLSEVGIDLKEEAIMDAAVNAGRQGSIFQRWKDRRRFEKTGLSLEPVIELDRDKLSRRVRELTREITEEPRDAAFKINSDDTVTIIPGRNGTVVDLDRLEKDILTILEEKGKTRVTLSLVSVPPERSTALVQSMGITGLLAAYTTTFNPAKTSRSYNISVAARALNELLVLPGHIVSFNEVVGPRSSESGYKNAPVIINNELVDGLGGGVCQVSTTLYNCILLANLEVVERTNHSLPVSYVPIGRDATVVYDVLDLKFRNNTGSYIYLKSYISGGRLTFKIYGNTAYKKEVQVCSWVTREIEPEVIYEEDPNLPKGEQVVKQEGVKGFKVLTQRVVSFNGVEKREMMPASDYNPVHKIIAVGVMEEDLQIAPSTPSPGSDGQNAQTGDDLKQPSVSGQVYQTSPVSSGNDAETGEIPEDETGAEGMIPAVSDNGNDSPVNEETETGSDS